MLIQLVDRIEPPQTALEDLFLRGVVADILLRKVGQLGFVPATYVNLVGSKSLFAAANPLRGRRQQHPKIALALDVIAASCGQSNLDLRQVASAVRMSPWHLSRLIHKETGIHLGRTCGAHAFAEAHCYLSLLRKASKRSQELLVTNGLEIFRATSPDISGCHQISGGAF